MILVPVKNSNNAKQRLSEVLDGASRTELAQAMLRDVLETLASWRDQSLPEHCSGIALVTSDTYAVGLADELRLEVIRDETNPGETGAIEMATRLCEERGLESTLVIPGDIPLLAGWELDEIYAKAPEEGSVLVPAADGRGTNAAWRRPAGLFPLRFGNDSFKPHLAAARASGKPCVILSLPGMAAGNGHAQQLARQWDLSGYPMAANE